MYKEINHLLYNINILHTFQNLLFIPFDRYNFCSGCQKELTKKYYLDAHHGVLAPH